MTTLTALPLRNILFRPSGLVHSKNKILWRWHGGTLTFTHRHRRIHVMSVFDIPSARSRRPAAMKQMNRKNKCDGKIGISTVCQEHDRESSVSLHALQVTTLWGHPHSTPTTKNIPMQTSLAISARNTYRHASVYTLVSPRTDRNRL